MRLVQEAREQDSDLSHNQAVIRIGQRTVVNADTLRGWVKQASIDRGERPGTTTGDAARIKALAHPARPRPGVVHADGRHHRHHLRQPNNN
jgi:transposase-like protein